MNFALLLVVLVALASAALASDDCQDKKKDVGDCTIKYHVSSLLVEGRDFLDLKEISDCSFYSSLYSVRRDAPR